MEALGMVTDQQVRRLFKMMQAGITHAHFAVEAGMDVQTARRY